MASSGVNTGCTSPAPPSPTCGKSQEGGVAAGVLVLLQPCPSLSASGLLQSTNLREEGTLGPGPHEAKLGKSLGRLSLPAAAIARVRRSAEPWLLLLVTLAQAAAAAPPTQLQDPGSFLCLPPPGAWRAAARFLIPPISQRRKL